MERGCKNYLITCLTFRTDVTYARYNLIPRNKFSEQVFNRVYIPGAKKGTLSTVTPHDAALLFMVFALGCFLSHTQSEDACEEYHQLAKTAMSCDAVLVDPTISAIRTLVIMIHELTLSKADNT